MTVAIEIYTRDEPFSCDGCERPFNMDELSYRAGFGPNAPEIQHGQALRFMKRPDQENRPYSRIMTICRPCAARLLADIMTELIG